MLDGDVNNAMVTQNLYLTDTSFESRYYQIFNLGGLLWFSSVCPVEYWKSTLKHCNKRRSPFSKYTHVNRPWPFHVT